MESVSFLISPDAATQETHLYLDTGDSFVGGANGLLKHPYLRLWSPDQLCQGQSDAQIDKLLKLARVYSDQENRKRTRTQP